MSATLKVKTFTPTTGFVRDAYRFDAIEMGGRSGVVADAEFDRWLQAHARESRSVEVSDEMVERALKVSLEFPRKRGLDNAHNVMRAAIEAALYEGATS
jgi:hypothetical protein